MDDSRTDSSTVAWLSDAIAIATRSTKFCVVGDLGAVDPGIEVEGLGRIALPLKRTTAKKLGATCRVAPYGKGTQTLVDRRVRKTFELDPQEFCLSDAWNQAIAAATRDVAEQLGLPADRLEARLYKLLMYETGGFFLPHRDSEKHDRMVASMVVALPSRFRGGALLVRHGAVKQEVTFDDAAAGKKPCYAAFYADCEHEVKRVTDGVRLCLAYNLVLKPNRAMPSAAAKPAAPAEALTESIGKWVAGRPDKPLVFALEHHYTERGLSLDLLKGVDRHIADLVVASAENTGCMAHLAQVSRHLSQFADDGSFAEGYSRRYRAQRQELEIGETYADDLIATQWTDARGVKQPWGDIKLDLSAVVASVPIDDWQPTAEEFEGYTGNAGNTLDRWYHRSAIVVWPREQHFEVVASCGAASSIPLFCSMAAKLAKTPAKRLEAARGDCIRFARAIIARWPRVIGAYASREPRDGLPEDDFPEHVLLLHDRDTIAMFLKKLAGADPSLQLKSFVPAACREFGCGALAEELKGLLSGRPDAHGQQELPLRDAEWLSAFCRDKSAGPDKVSDPDKAALAGELCALAVERFSESSRPQRTSQWDDDEDDCDWDDPHLQMSASEKSLPWLLQALLACGCDEGLSQVLGLVRKSPGKFGLDKCQVPGLNSLIPWSRKQFGSVPPQLTSWLAAVRQRLESATAQRPEPAADWARPANVACKCRFCAQLNAFLTDPANQVGRIPAREDMRRHLTDAIGRHRCDVTHALERKGSPYALVLTKTSESFKRALKRFEADCRLLAALPVAE